jgi:trehalose-6-phosphate synthase
LNFKEEDWEAYTEANMKFAEALFPIMEQNDLLWVQDYHLMLLPQLLRERLPAKYNVKIGFFLHTPFPSSEIYRFILRFCLKDIP